MDSNPVVVQAEEALDASVAAFMAALGGSSGVSAGCGPCGHDDDPLQRIADAALEVLGGVARSEAKVAAMKTLAAAVLAGAMKALNPPPVSPHEATAQDRSLVAEVGCALAIGDRAAGALLAEAHALTTSLPRTLAALQAGTISWAHARTMVDQAVSLAPAAAAALEAHFLDPDAPSAVRGCPVGEMPAYRFKARARAWRERHHPESLEKRHARSAADRRIEYWPDNDAMAWVAAYLPADQASAIWNRLTAISRGRQGPDEARTLTQLRADTFAEALLTSGTTSGNSRNSSGAAGTSGPTGAGHSDGHEEPNSAGHGEPNSAGHDDGSSGSAGHNGGYGDGHDAGGSGGGEAAGPGPSTSIRPQVLVTVPVFSLMGLTDEPAVLDGHGPIPASMARDLVAGGADSFHRVLVDPRDGAPLEIGRTSYRVTKAMRTWLRLRDGKCPFPGCSNSSLDNEADHLLAWHQGGTTGISNLGQPCPKHHKLRHTSGWKPTPATTTEPPGWTSPTGRHYTSEHQDWEPPHWPERAVPDELRALDDLLELWRLADDPSELWRLADDPSELWRPPDDLSELPLPDDLSPGWPPPTDLSPQDLYPQEPSSQDPYPQEELPEDTYADWFLPGYQPPKDPLPEDAWWEMACQASTGVTS
ncbi:HNH endonuclease signature motif containing protein [Pseudarthrobacter sp. L1SW]|uniref:HNH endonuclease signature motif containing protein n=1 Tax=Pseudarthrobacter sp. L1SW TaxID=2851598 RepID=UPI001E46955F|nr:HNH endonuclease signature motif containing protein [Pseudarthrobacter sp. L1SW]UEL29186.1 HNH endonuclease [Pseudarthrobacter sp. L1SW]